MAFQLRKVDYFSLVVPEAAGKACQLLAGLAELGVDLLAFAAVPFGPDRTQLTLFPRDAGPLQRAATQAGFALDGPHPALLAQGADELGALAKVHRVLEQAGVEVYASSGVADGHGRYGYVLYVRPSSLARAGAALELG